MCPSGKQMRVAEKMLPCQAMMFSPLVLISSPAPCARSSHATRLVTSKSPTLLVGWIVSHTQKASAAEVRPAQACQLPIEPLYAGGGSGVVKVAVSDQGPIHP